MKRFVMGLFASAAFLSPNGAVGADVKAGMGPGFTTCAQFSETYRQAPKIGEEYYFAWAQGFMSGWNVAPKGSENTIIDLNVIPVESQQRHIRRYCSENPLKDYLDAVVDLYLAVKAAQPSN